MHKVESAMFIKLTLTKTNSPLYLSPDKIVCLFKHLDENGGGFGTRIVVVDNHEHFTVKETPEQVMALVAKASRTKSGPDES